MSNSRAVCRHSALLAALLIYFSKLPDFYAVPLMKLSTTQVAFPLSRAALQQPSSKLPKIKSQVHLPHCGFPHQPFQENYQQLKIVVFCITTTFAWSPVSQCPPSLSAAPLQPCDHGSCCLSLDTAPHDAPVSVGTAKPFVPHVHGPCTCTFMQNRVTPATLLLCHTSRHCGTRCRWGNAGS